MPKYGTFKITYTAVQLSVNILHVFWPKALF